MPVVTFESNGVTVNLFVRISTPTNPISEAIDPSLPTILLLHPVWLDSYFFYPQRDDPLFNEHYNIVAIDMRGHGQTTVSGLDETFDVPACAFDMAAGLDGLGVEAAHIVGVGYGAFIAASMGFRTPHKVLSLVLVSLPPAKDTEDTSAAYDELQQALKDAVRDKDFDLLDEITIATFDYDAGVASQQDIIRDLRDDYKKIARMRFGNLTDEQCATAAWYIYRPIATRFVPPATTIGSINSNILLLHGVGVDESSTFDPEGYATIFNFAHASAGSDVRATFRMVEGVGHFMTLTSPNVVNPLIAKFIGTPSSAGLPPLPSPLVRISGSNSQPRRSSTPHGVTPRGAAFDIPQLPRISPGIRTIGDEMDAQNESINKEEIVEVFVEDQ